MGGSIDVSTVTVVSLRSCVLRFTVSQKSSAQIVINHRGDLGNGGGGGGVVCHPPLHSFLFVYNTIGEDRN